MYGIVKQNEGFINVYSEPGKGTTVRIYLRREVGTEIRSPADPIAGVPRGRGERVLVVEDEGSILKLVTGVLSDLGYSVLSSMSPKDAVRIATERDLYIDLLISDVVMPGMDGAELAAQVRRHHPNIRVLFMSGYTENVIVHHGVLDEHVNYLQKPFTRVDLGLKVRSVLDGRA